MSTEKTAWHPPFTVLIGERGPRWVQVSGEVRVATELRLDDLIEVLAGVARDPDDRGAVLRGMWGFLTWVGLLEFKSISRPFRGGDLSGCWPTASRGSRRASTGGRCGWASTTRTRGRRGATT